MIIQVADTHLGFSSFGGVYNLQRKEDVKQAFVQVIDQAVTIIPDLFVHCGDLFDSPYPSYDILLFAVNQLQRLIDKGIKVIIISGTHDTPKRSSEPHVFSVLEHVFQDTSFINFIYKDNKVICHIVDKKGVEILCIPFTREAVTLTERYDIVVYHGGVEGLIEYQSSVRKLYDKADNKCILMGDYHNPIEIKKGWVYAGATERFSFNQESNPVGFWEIDKLGNRKYRILRVRDMVSRDFDLVDTKVDDISRSLNPDSLNRIYLKNWKGENLKPLMSLPFVQIELVSSKENEVEILIKSSSSLIEDWGQYCEQQQIKDTLKERGIKYLNEEDNQR